MTDRVREFFDSLQTKIPTVAGQVVNVTRDSTTGRPTSASVLVAGSTIRVPLGLEAPVLGPGDYVRLAQYGSATAAEYRLVDAVAGARPTSGYYQFLEDTELYGQTYPAGDVVMGDLVGGNIWVEYDTGNLHHRIGTQINAVDFATGEKLIGKTTLAGGVYTPVGPNMLLSATSLKLRQGTTDKVVINSDGSASFTGSITAASGHVGGFAITATTLASDLDTILLDAANGIIRVGGTSDYIELLGASGAIRTKAYGTSGGLNGWQIARDGSANFNNITARGSIRASVFEKGLISATAGTLLVAYSAGKLASDYTVGGTLTVDTPPGGGWLFRTGDIIEIKAEYSNGVGDTYVTVTRTATENQYSTAYSSGTNAITYPAGTGVVDWGKTGDGALSLSADGVLGAAPNLSVFTHAGAPWTTKTLRARLGNLDGIAGASGYGLWTDNGYFTGVVNVTGGNAAKTDMSNVTEIDGGKIKTGTITTQHLAVGTPGNMINNFSVTRNLDGWDVPAEGITLLTMAKDGVSVRALRSLTNATHAIYSNYIEVDPNASYEVRLSIYSNIATSGTRYFGIQAYDANKNVLYTRGLALSTRTWDTWDTYRYFWSGNAPAATWRDMVGHVVGCNVQANEVLTGQNVTDAIQLPTNARYIRLRLLNYKNAGVTVANYYFSPSITPIHAATISGDMLVSGTLRAGNILTLTGGNITVGAGGEIVAGATKIVDSGVVLTSEAVDKGPDGTFAGTSLLWQASTGASPIGRIWSTYYPITGARRLTLAAGTNVRLDLDGGNSSAASLNTSLSLGGTLYLSGSTLTSISGNSFTLIDDASSGALSADGASRYGIYFVNCSSEWSAAIVSVTSQGVAIVYQSADRYRTVDTEGYHCVLVNVLDQVFMLNRRGGNRTYRIIKLA